MKSAEKANIEKYFEKRVMAELHRIYAEYMLEVETDAEWDRVEKQFNMFTSFVKYMDLRNKLD